MDNRWWLQDKRIRRRRDTDDEDVDDSSSLSSVGDVTNDDATLRGRHQVNGAKRPLPEQPGVRADHSPNSPITYRAMGGRSGVKKSDSEQQTENSAFRQVTNTQWNRFVKTNSACDSAPQSPVELRRGKCDSSGVRMHIGNGDNRKQNSITVNINGSGVMSPIPSRRVQDVHNQKNIQCVPPPPMCPAPPVPTQQQLTTNNGRMHTARGMPASFGYVKRPTNSPLPSPKHKGEEVTRTAQVSGVPRVDTMDRVSLERPNARATKVKVSGGTQTTADLLAYSTSDSECVSPRSAFYSKSYSLTAPSAAHSAQGLPHHLLDGTQSLPKTISSSEYSMYPPSYYMGNEGGPCRHPVDGSLSESISYANYSEVHGPNTRNPKSYSWLKGMPSGYSASVSSGPSSMPGMLAEADSLESLSSCSYLQHPRSCSLTHNRLLLHQQRERSTSPSPRINRSSSISYFQERTFPRSTKSEKLYPAIFQRSEEEGYYSSPGKMNSSNPVSSSNSNQGISRINTSYGGIQLTKMPSKEDDVHGSTMSLVSTASSLYNTTEEKHAYEVRKLRKELSDAQEKVSSLTSLLATNAHVVTAFEQSLGNMTNRLQHLTSSAEQKDSELTDLRQAIEKLRNQTAEARRNGEEIINATNSNPMARHLSTDSVSSINSLSSACSAASHHSREPSPPLYTDSPGTKKKKKGWLRSSFSKAFSRSRKGTNGSISDIEDGRTDLSVPSSPHLSNTQRKRENNQSRIATSCSSSVICGEEGISNNSLDGEEQNERTVVELKKQLREKDIVLTDIRLEALTSAHQLESLKETVNKMRSDMQNLKQDNERLQKLITSKSLASSQNSIGHSDSLNRRRSTSECAAPAGIDILLGDLSDKEGRRISLTVVIGSNTCSIGCISVSTKTKWDVLDKLVQKLLMEYVFRIDPVSSLGLAVDSVVSYQVGMVKRSRKSDIPQLLPCSYLVGDTNTIQIDLGGATDKDNFEALAFDTLIPKSIIQRYVSLLMEHRRIILCGPSGTGKSYLANKLAEFLILKSGKDVSAEQITTFSVDHETSKELQHYLSHIAEKCESNICDLPQVIILDNLHEAGSLGEIFNGFLSVEYTKCPYIIGTMTEGTCSTTNLQLHYNFRWILCANHMEPVKGFLGRYFRRRLIESEVAAGEKLQLLGRVLEWVPKVWIHLNKFLETHSSSDVTVGPRLFLPCPIDESASQVWFTDLWNYSIVPYLMEAVREGLQLYGRRAPWEDPSIYLLQTYPWEHAGHDALIRIRQEDVGYDTQPVHSGTSNATTILPSQNEVDVDPLLNMLKRLQEAANYSSPPSNDSDCTSQDSHTNSLRNEGKLNTGMESTL